MSEGEREGEGERVGNSVSPYLPSGGGYRRSLLPETESPGLGEGLT